MRPNARNKKWKDILADGSCYCLEPFAVDGLLGGDVKSYAAVAGAKAGYAPGTNFMQRDSGGFESFIYRAACHICKEMSLQVEPSMFDELTSAVRARVLAAIPSYLPGKETPGGFVRWGFEAYLYNFPVKKAFSDFAKELRKSSGLRLEQGAGDSDFSLLEVLDADSGTRGPGTVAPLQLDTIESAFDQALVLALKDEPGRVEYCLYNHSGMTVEEIAKMLGITLSACYRRLVRASENVSRRLQERIAFLLGTDVTTARTEILGYLAGGAVRYQLPLDVEMSAAYHDLIDANVEVPSNLNTARRTHRR